MQPQNNKKKYISKFQTITQKYEGLCPECGGKLVFAEASFYCPMCGFCEKDFVLESKDVEPNY